MERKQLDPARVARALGSKRVVPMSNAPSRGPLDLLHLRMEVDRRIKSSGGRPTDPEWTMTRVVRFQPTRWEELENLALTLSQDGSTVSPSQIAAMLVERGLDELTPLRPRPSASGQAGGREGADYPTPLIRDEYYLGLASPTACLDLEV
jgi:hypothetical protein